MENIYSQQFSVRPEERENRNQQACLTFWLTGLSGSGKSTLANALERTLHDKGYRTYLLDGDNTREGIGNNLGFSVEDRKENIRRIAEISKLMNEAGVICINSFVSPTKSIRGMARDIIGQDRFIEVYVSTSLTECESRDVKGLYARARKGEIKDFTGIDAPYEAPDSPEFTVNTEGKTIEESLEELVTFVVPKLKLHE